MARAARHYQLGALGIHYPLKSAIFLYSLEESLPYLNLRKSAINQKHKTRYVVTTFYIACIVAGHALGIWICRCSLFYKRELWDSKSAGANSTKSLKISGCKTWCPKDLRVREPAAPALTHSLIWCK